MEDPDPHHNASGRRLGFSTENFDDYLVALMADLRSDTVSTFISLNKIGVRKLKKSLWENWRNRHEKIEEIVVK